MKHRTRLFSLLAACALVLSLSACGDRDSASLPSPSDTNPAAPSGDAQPSPSSLLPDDFVPDTSVEDLCLAVAGVPGDFALLTVNGAPVTARSYLYWLTSNTSYVETYYGLTMDSGDWLADYLKEESLTAAVQYHLIAAKARELGYELTQEQQDELDGNLALTAAMLGGEEAFADALRMSGLDYDTFYEINAASYYYTLLQEGLLADRPTAEEMDAYIEENDLLYAKHILLMTVDPSTREPLDAETIAQKKATAEDLLSQLQASSDLSGDFDALMNKYSEDSGLSSNPDGYTFTAGEMVSEFETATRALEYGQLSGLVESPYGYHIILRLDPDTQANRSSLRADLLNEQLDAWTDEAELVLSEEYQALDPQLVYEKYAAYQQAFAAEEAAEPSEN